MTPVSGEAKGGAASAADKPGKRGSRGVGRSTSSVCSFRVPNDLREQWDEYVADHREEASEAMRTLMRHLVKQRQPAHVDKRSVFLTPTPVAATKDVDRSKKKPLKIYFTESELAALVRVADERECSIQFWITSLVRARLTDGASLGGTELKALGESLYQVTAIGRNLNQITHHINADPGKNLHRVTERSIARLLNVIEDHRLATHRVIEANTHRWKLT